MQLLLIRLGCNCFVSDWDATVINQTGMQLFCVRLGCNCFVSDCDATVLCQIGQNISSVSSREVVLDPLLFLTFGA